MQRLNLDLHDIADHLPLPDNLPPALVDVLDLCWIYDHRNRAPISDIKHILKAASRDSVRSHCLLHCSLHVHVSPCEYGTTANCSKRLITS
jgi:hypothetical protein